jgi:hypothetical protein
MVLDILHPIHISIEFLYTFNTIAHKLMLEVSIFHLLLQNAQVLYF